MLCITTDTESCTWNVGTKFPQVTADDVSMISVDGEERALVAELGPAFINNDIVSVWEGDMAKAVFLLIRDTKDNLQTLLPMPVIDYRELLKKYMDIVGICEGITFVPTTYDERCKEVGLSEDEWKALRKVEEVPHSSPKSE